MGGGGVAAIGLGSWQLSPASVITYGMGSISPMLYAQPAESGLFGQRVLPLAVDSR